MRDAEIFGAGSLDYRDAYFKTAEKKINLVREIHGWKLQNEELQTQLKEANQQIKDQQELIKCFKHFIVKLEDESETNSLLELLKKHDEYTQKYPQP